MKARIHYIFIALAVMAVAASSALYVKARRAAKPNVVVILIDALRKDHLGCYGYNRKTSPVIDSLAEGGLIFKNNITQTACTASSVRSTFTSKYPSQLLKGESAFEAGRNLQKLPEDEVTLAEVMKENGYFTGSVVTNPWVSDKFGMTQGFEKAMYLGSDLKGANATKVVDNGISLIGESMSLDKPFFLYMHFIDVHSPTDPPEPFSTMYPTIDSAPHNQLHHNFSFEDGKGLETEEFQRYKSHKVALYDGSINYVDSQVGRLVDYLEKKKLKENTVIIIMADHGEGLWDHADFERTHLAGHLPKIGTRHGNTLFAELIETPFIFYGKDIPKGKVETQTRNLDLMPSVLGIAGIKKADIKMKGVDVVSSFRDGTLKDLVAISGQVNEKAILTKAIQDADYKYMVYGEKEFLFKKGPGFEQADVSKDYPEEKKRLKRLLRTIEKDLKPGSDGGMADMDQQTVKELKALGYLQ